MLSVRTDVFAGDLTPWETAYRCLYANLTTRGNISLPQCFRTQTAEILEHGLRQHGHQVNEAPANDSKQSVE